MYAPEQELTATTTPSIRDSHEGRRPTKQRPCQSKRSNDSTNPEADLESNDDQDDDDDDSLYDEIEADGEFKSELEQQKKTLRYPLDKYN
ncbi:hypothetical protein MMC21_003940 [Puttea exsequens]|nr:hypothetical protein [Puttea exsequens]